MALIEIKKKIESTRNTRKITQALQLVAASKMKRFQREAESSRAYAGGLLEGLLASAGDLEGVSFAEERKEGKVLFILVTSDKGLCGALNAKLIRTLIASEEWNAVPASERLLIPVGRKAADAARRLGETVPASFEGIDEDMDALKALAIIEPVLALWESGEVREVRMVSPRYVNAFTSVVRIHAYLPLSAGLAKERLGADDVALTGTVPNAIYEPDEERLVGALSEQLVQMLFISAFYELKASEYSSRMVAMKKATDSADDIVHDLTLEYNKARQAAITQSLSELAAAGEAIT